MYLFKLQKNFDIKIEKNWMLLKTNSGTKMGKFKDPFTLFTIKNDKLYILNNCIYQVKTTIRHGNIVNTQKLHNLWLLFWY